MYAGKHKEYSQRIHVFETSLFKLLNFRQKQQIKGEKAKKRKKERKKGDGQKENHANTMTIRI